MTPISVSRRVLACRLRRKPAGFTLLEILLVLTILGFASYMVLPNLGSLETRTFSAQVRGATSLLNYARRLAVVQGQPGTASFYSSPSGPDTERAANNSVGSWHAGASTELSFRDSTDQEIEVEDLIEITFYPEGGSTGGTLLLQLDDQLVAIEIDPFNGRVSTRTNEE